MSLTNEQIIGDALREINVISEVAAPSAEQGKYGMRRLNQMMEIWRENDVDVGYFAQDSTTAVCPIPDWAELAVTTSLAVALAPKYGATVSAELAAVGDQAMNMVQRKSLNEKLRNTDMSHMPVGQGNYGDGYYNINTDT